jgi:cytochrome d ubiquinol oxidase subunit I
MIGLGGVAALTAVVGLWLTRKKAKREVPVWAWRIAIWAWPASLLALLLGWVFTEMGRQPWIVFGLMLTEDGVSPSVPGWTVLISLVAFTAIYAILAVVEVGLIMKTAHTGPEPLPEPGSEGAEPPALEDTPTTVY